MSDDLLNHPAVLKTIRAELLRGSYPKHERQPLGAGCSGHDSCVYEFCVFTEQCVNGIWQEVAAGC